MCQQTEQREAGRAAALTHTIRMPRTDRAATTSAHTFVLLFYNSIDSLTAHGFGISTYGSRTWMHKTQRLFMSIHC